MALYYESKDKVKGKLLDELAKEKLGDWDPSVGNTILERISATLPSIEKILPIDSKLLVGEGKQADLNRRQFKEAAGLMYDFINRKNIPPSLVAAIADAPQVQNKGKRFNRIFSYIDSIAARTELNKYELFPALEELVRKTGSFVDLERVASRYNLFFANADVLAEYTEMVAELVGSGWKTDTVADLMAVTYQHLLGKQAAEVGIDIAVKAKIVKVDYSPAMFEETKNKQVAEIEEKWEELKKKEWKAVRKTYLGSLKQLVQSLAEEDLELLTKEVSLLSPPESKVDAGEQGQAYTSDVAIENLGQRKLSLRKLEKSGDRFGLFLGLAGRLSQEYDFNDVISKAEITSGMTKAVTDGTFLAFNHGEERITLKLEKKEGEKAGSIEVEGLAPEELRLFMLDLQRAGMYVSAVYDAIDILGTLPHGKKRLNCWSADGNIIQYLSPSMSCQIKDINLQQRTADHVSITVNAGEKVRLYEALKQIGLDAKFRFYPEMTESGLELELELKGIPSATQQPMQDEKFAEQKKTLQNMLAAVDEYATVGAESTQYSLVDFLCYLNRSADREKLPELLSHGEGVLQSIGPLFVYPQTFGKNFELLTELEQKIAVSVLYAVEPTNELSSAREWLNKHHSDLAADIGMDEV